MCDEGEKTCPLCAEEMDLTDQQLKPCKCGYEVCVWCWNHIMEMAEKDGTEGRCPACRTPYDKEKIVTASKCERLVAEINMEKKIKSQKTKAKVAEGRKQLSSVRVIQRNLVYIVGLPLNLADEDILQTKEYFGQYGKVLKVSMSRTAAGVIQQFPNNTCSVYITYAKEEEAIRCIQSVHGFTLEDRQLRACFGTTKYCHAWLRSVPCNNPDCLYLHEIGSQEDSFTKDEIISAYTRVEQITATTNTLQKRSGTILPPPVDNYCNGSSATAGKPIVKIPSSSAASVVRGSPPTGSASSRSMALPAAASWGTRGLNCSSQSSNAECPIGSSKSKIDSNGSIKSKLDSVSRTSTSAGSSATEPPNLHGNVVKKGPSLKDGNHNIVNAKVDTSHNLDSLSDKYYEQDGPTASDDKRRLSPSKDKASENSSGGFMEVSSTGHAEAKVIIPDERNFNNLCGDISSLSINRNLHPEPGAERPDTLASDPHFIGSPKNQGIQQPISDDQHEESLASVVLHRKVDPSVSEVCGKTDQFASMLSEVEEDILSFDSQRLKDPEVNHSSYLPSLTSPHHLPNQFTSNSPQHHNVFGDRRTNDCSFLHQAPPGLPNGHVGNSQSTSILQRRTESSFFPSNDLQGRHSGMRVDATYSERNGRLDAGESNIISNILSMDFDPWNDSLTSPHHLAKMFGNADGEHGSIGSNHWKAPNISQSRFSFARQEDSVSQPSNYQSFTGFEQQMQRNNGFEQQIQRNNCFEQQVQRNNGFEQQIQRNNGFEQQIQRNNGFEQQIQRNKSIDDDDQDLFFHKLGIPNGFPSRNSLEASNMASSPFAASRTSVPTPRSQISAPPGFSLHSKAPPPGFATTERVEHESLSGNHHHRMLEMPPVMLRNGSEAQMMNGNITSADIEFMDPAILAVGKGRPQSNLGYDIRSFQQQHNMRQPFENDSRLDLLSHQRSSSFSSHQNHHQLVGGYDMGVAAAAAAAGYPLTDSSRVLDQQSPLGNLSFAAQLSFQQQQQQQQGRNGGVVSNGHWNGGWNDAQSGNNGMVMAELLRNERERLGMNKQQQQQLYSNGFDDTKYRMPSSGDHLYNRTFGM